MLVELTANPTRGCNKQLLFKRPRSRKYFRASRRMILKAIDVDFYSSFVSLEMSGVHKDDNFPETNRNFVPEKWSDNYGHDCPREPNARS